MVYFLGLLVQALSLVLRTNKKFFDLNMESANFVSNAAWCIEIVQTLVISVKGIIATKLSEIISLGVCALSCP